MAQYRFQQLATNWLKFAAKCQDDTADRDHLTVYSPA